MSFSTSFVSSCDKLSLIIRCCIVLLSHTRSAWYVDGYFLIADKPSSSHTVGLLIDLVFVHNQKDAFLSNLHIQLTHAVQDNWEEKQVECFSKDWVRIFLSQRPKGGRFLTLRLAPPRPAFSRYFY